jgi:hypothetical protein
VAAPAGFRHTCQCSSGRVAQRLRAALLPCVANSALIIFTEDCTGRPRKTTREEEIISRVSIAELVDLRAGLTDAAPWFGEAVLAGRLRAVLELKHDA